MVRTNRGLPFFAYVSASRLISNEGETIGTVWVIKDISELKKSEIKLRESVEQKEVLLREVHHRVKNNLQVIESFNYNNNSNKFDLKKYEREIRNSLAKTASDKLIFKLSSIQ